MGMYDSVQLEIECPYCGEISMMEAQTKQLDCMLNIYSIGDNISFNMDNVVYKNLYCITNCESVSCLRHSETSNGRFFDIKVKLKDSVITGEYEVISIDY